MAGIHSAAVRLIRRWLSIKEEVIAKSNIERLTNPRIIRERVNIAKTEGKDIDIVWKDQVG